MDTRRFYSGWDQIVSIAINIRINVYLNRDDNIVNDGNQKEVIDRYQAII